MKRYELTDIGSQIRTYLVQNVLFSDGKVQFSDSDSLLETGIVDSGAVMELVMFVEEAFNVSVEDHEIIPDNFDSISKLSNFVFAKLTPQA